MKIVHLLKHCELGHGNVHLAIDLACAQAAYGHDVIVASAGGEFEGLLLENGVHHVTFSQSPRDGLFKIKNLVEFNSLFRDPPQVVHAHMMSSAIIAAGMRLLRGVPVITTVHNSFDRHSVIMRLGDYVVAISEAERETLLSRGYSDKRTVTILNGIIGSRRLSYKIENSPYLVKRPNIITVCGLHKRKGVDDLIEAFRLMAAKVPAAHLYIVGDGPDKETLKRTAIDSGLSDRIVFMGQLADPSCVLSQSDVFVLASHQEPFGLVNIEARSCGCAMIATRVGGMVEALEYGRAGILVPPRAPEVLSKAIESLLLDQQLLSEMKFRSTIGLEKFDVKTMASKYLSLYDLASANTKSGRTN